MSGPENNAAATSDSGANRSLGSGSALDVITWVDRGRAMCEVAGDLDLFTRDRLNRALIEVQLQANRPLLVLVLTSLSFADSSGLSALIAAAKRAQGNGGGAALVEAPEHLSRVLRVTGLTALLPEFPGLEQAWKWLDEVAP